MKLFGFSIAKTKELRGIRTKLRLKTEEADHLRNIIKEKQEFINSCGEKGDMLRRLVKNLSQTLNEQPTIKEVRSV